MVSKRDCVIGAVIVYFLLILLYFTLDENQRIENICYFDNNRCVRFCCYDQTSCDEKFIRKNFNSSLLPNENKTDYLILYDKLSCETEKVDKEWKFALVNKKISNKQ